MGELNLSATYDLTSHFKVRAGYEIMWLNGRALAPDQIDTSVAQTNALHPIINTAAPRCSTVPSSVAK